MKDKWTLTEVSVDWLTATAPTGPEGIRLFDLGARLLASEAERGNPGRPTNFEGYHGTVSAHLFAGWRIDGACVRLGGRMARDWWRDVAGLATNITRLDIALTAKCEPPNPDYPREVFIELPAHGSRPGRPVEYSLIQSRIGGQTLYCGRRASEHFGRIYDKHRESKGQYPDGTIRFEIEYKAQAAKEIAGYLKAGADTVPRLIGIMRRRMQDWGVLLPVSDPGIDWRPSPIEVRTTQESRMKWLNEQVNVTVEKLSSSYTADQLRQALGLQWGTEAAYSADDPRLEIFRLANEQLRAAKSEQMFGTGETNGRDRSQPDDGATGASGNRFPRRPKPPSQPPRGESVEDSAPTAPAASAEPIEGDVEVRVPHPDYADVFLVSDG